MRAPHNGGRVFCAARQGGTPREAALILGESSPPYPPDARGHSRNLHTKRDSQSLHKQRHSERLENARTTISRLKTSFFGDYLVTGLVTKEKGQKLQASDLVFHGAGDGNRTRVISLEG